jgi:hypothetical protein
MTYDFRLDLNNFTDLKSSYSIKIVIFYIFLRLLIKTIKMEPIFILYKELLNKTLEMNSLQIAEEILKANNHLFESKIVYRKKSELYQRIQLIHVEIENISKIDKLILNNTPWINELSFIETYWSIDFTVVEKIENRINELQSKEYKSPLNLKEIEFLNFFIS